MNDNTKWFSQTLLTFKDKMYATDGYLRVAISTNTEDYKNFNPPMFNISISNNYQKTYNLNIQHAEDLYESFTQVIKTLNGHDVVVEKKYQKNTNIIFKFSVESSNNERVVIIEILSSDSDSVKVIIPAKPTFQSFVRRLKYFIENYDDICMKLLTTTLNQESFDIIQRLPGLIKGISAQIVSQIPEADIFTDSRAPKIDEQIDEQEIKNAMCTINDLDKFLGDDMSNIKIADIEDGTVETKPQVSLEIKSPFFEKVINNDLYNLESKLTSFTVSKQPILDLANDLSNTLGFNVLPGLSEDDKKSLVYFSTLFQNYYSKAYTINDSPIPSGTPPLKYKSRGTQDNIDFAKDLLLVIGYMRTVRRRLENKINNAYDNKSLTYLYLRCFMDPLCFSYIDNMNSDEIVSAIKNRYMYFDNIGVFNKYKQILIDNNCPEIELNDILSFATETIEKIIGKTLYINELHERCFNDGNFKLPSKNTFNLEQITNEFIPLEVNYKIGFDFNDKDAVTNMRNQNNISDEVFGYFIGKQKIQKTIVREKITPLQRWIEKFKQDIPEQYKDDVVQYVKDLKYEKFDILSSPWPLSEFDERVVKAFYLWDPSVNENIKTNFNEFATMIENEVMTKEMILTATTSGNTNDSVWNNIDL